MTDINLSSLPTLAVFDTRSTNVVDYSVCVVAPWWLKVLVVVDVVDVVGF